MNQIKEVQEILATAGLDSSVLESVSSKLGDAVKYVEELSNNVQTTNAKFNEAVATRTKTKEKLKSLVGTLGLPEDFSEDDLKTVVARVQGQDGKGDDIRKEMAEKLERTKLQYEAQIKEYDTQLRNKSSLLETVAFQREVQSVLSTDKELTPSAYRYVEYDLKTTPHRFNPETGQVEYLDKDGNVRLNLKGAAYTVADMYNDLKDKGSFDALRGVSITGSNKSPSDKSPLNNPNSTTQELFRAGLSKLKK